MTEWLMDVALPIAVATLLITGTRALWRSGRTQRAVAVAILVPLPVLWAALSVLWLVWGSHDPWFSGTSTD